MTCFESIKKMIYKFYHLNYKYLQNDYIEYYNECIIILLIRSKRIKNLAFNTCTPYKNDFYHLLIEFFSRSPIDFSLKVFGINICNYVLHGISV